MRFFLAIFFSATAYLNAYAMEQPVLPTKAKKPFNATIESLKIVTDLAKNRSIVKPLAQLMRVDENSLRKSTVDELLKIKDAHVIKTAYANHEGLMELLKKETPNKEEQINAKMDYELKQKGRYVRWRFLKGSIQFLGALGIGAVLFYDIKNFGQSLIARELKPMDAAKMGFCFAGLGFASLSLCTSGLNRINKALSHENYCIQQKRIALENREIVYKLEDFNFTRSNPDTPHLGEIESSSNSEYGSSTEVYPSNKDTTKDKTN
ncbi:hypothetical protein HYX58_04235 [Candidatus Dependentiae bacterium]|nr:hypothetical protein [Candidatus Dependentiae bacterium]